MTVENTPNFYFKADAGIQNTQPAQNNTNIQYQNYQPAPINGEKPDSYVTKDGKEKTALSKGAKIGIFAAAIAAIAGGIYLYKSGKGKKAADAIKSFFSKNKTNIQNKTEQIIGDTSKQGEKTVNKISKTFTNNEGTIIDNVRIEKGKALLGDGSGFTGVMETVTNGKTPKNVKLTYENGFLTSSSLDGKLYKKFEAYNGDRAKALKITQFDISGNSLPISVHSYHENGKLKRIWNGTKNTSLDFSEKGKIIAKGTYVNESIIKNAEIFDENGNIIKKFKKDSNACFVEETFSDGKLTKRKIGSASYTSPIKTMDELSVTDPKFVGFYNSEGKLEKSLSYQRGGVCSGDVIAFCEGENEYKLSGAFAPNHEPTQMQIETGDNVSAYLGEEMKHFKILPDSVKTGKRGIPTKEEHQTILQKLKEANSIAEREGVHVDAKRISEHLKVLESHIKTLK